MAISPTVFEQLRQVIGLRQYGQRSFIRIQEEAFILFEGLLSKIKKDVIKLLFNLNIIVSSDRQNENFKKKILMVKEIKAFKKLEEMKNVHAGLGKNLSIVMETFN